MTRSDLPKGTIQLEAVSFGYRTIVAVEGVDGRFASGSMTAIHGSNGAGKTTLLDGIAGFVRPMGGRVVKAAGTRVAYLPQQSRIDRAFPINAWDVVALGSWPRSGALLAITGAERAAIADALQKLDIVGLAHRPIASLSSGQFQRVLFARAITQDADVILLDEPFNAVDRRTTGFLLDLLHDLHAAGKTIIAVLHDTDQIHQHFERTLLLARRCVAWDVTAIALDVTNRQAALAMADDTRECAVDR